MTHNTTSEYNSCPLCHNPVTISQENCNHCGAIRLTGLSVIEALVCALIGLVVFSAFSTLLIALSLWTILFALIGLGGGFLVAYYHFPAEKWEAPR